MSEKYPLPKNLATPRLQKLNHPWNRGYPNNKRVVRAFGAMARVPGPILSKDKIDLDKAPWLKGPIEAIEAP